LRGPSEINRARCIATVRRAGSSLPLQRRGLLQLPALQADLLRHRPGV